MMFSTDSRMDRQLSSCRRYCSWRSILLTAVLSCTARSMFSCGAGINYFDNETHNNVIDDGTIDGDTKRICEIPRQVTPLDQLQTPCQVPRPFKDNVRPYSIHIAIPSEAQNWIGSPPADPSNQGSHSDSHSKFASDESEYDLNHVEEKEDSPEETDSEPIACLGLTADLKARQANAPSANSFVNAVPLKSETRKELTPAGPRAASTCSTVSDADCHDNQSLTTSDRSSWETSSRRPSLSASQSSLSSLDASIQDATNAMRRLQLRLSTKDSRKAHNKARSVFRSASQNPLPEPKSRKIRSASVGRRRLTDDDFSPDTFPPFQRLARQAANRD